MLAFLGDIHGSDKTLKFAHDRALESGATALIQVGDFGWFANTKTRFAMWRWELPIYFIDGNHESFGLLRRDAPSATEPTEVLPNVHFVPRGTTLTLDGRRILFLGGAGSIDKVYRCQNGLHWESAERITPEDLDRAIAAQTPDLMVTHTPPQWVITKEFDERDPMEKTRLFGVKPDWRDSSAALVEEVWEHHGRPLLVCGHMHRAVTSGPITILDIADFRLLPAGAINLFRPVVFP